MTFGNTVLHNDESKSHFADANGLRGCRWSTCAVRTAQVRIQQTTGADSGARDETKPLLYDSTGFCKLITT